MEEAYEGWKQRTAHTNAEKGGPGQGQSSAGQVASDKVSFSL